MNINYEKQSKKLQKQIKKFLGNYLWANCDMARDNGICVGYFDDADSPEHVKQVNKLYEIMED